MLHVQCNRSSENLSKYSRFASDLSCFPLLLLLLALDSISIEFQATGMHIKDVKVNPFSLISNSWTKNTSFYFFFFSSPRMRQITNFIRHPNNGSALVTIFHRKIVKISSPVNHVHNGWPRKILSIYHWMSFRILFFFFFSFMDTYDSPKIFSFISSDA